MDLFVNLELGSDRNANHIFASASHMHVGHGDSQAYPGAARADVVARLNASPQKEETIMSTEVAEIGNVAISRARRSEELAALCLGEQAQLPGELHLQSGHPIGNTYAEVLPVCRVNASRQARRTVHLKAPQRSLDDGEASTNIGLDLTDLVIEKKLFEDSKVAAQQVPELPSYGRKGEVWTAALYKRTRDLLTPVSED